MKAIGPIIDKTEAFIISEIFNNSDNSIVYIGKDDREIINIKKKLSWLLPNEKILLYRLRALRRELTINHPMLKPF